ncbi:hypothetical protein [Thermococcus sp. MV11]|uniref:hypothetical protein n=1 Tax=Thermococcus sp. MV11 TaxID=1638267 RepID=UPI00142F4848|nr:hypothetical protein [Thermococcus sp. MV11]NJE03093.1 hypothetical protein [Thermococcus sp. MV11]
MDRIKLLAGLSAVLILIATGATWAITRDINTTIVILTLASTLATVMMAVTIYELDIALKELNFEAVSEVYEMMDENLKENISKIKRWHAEDLQAGRISGGVLVGPARGDFLKDEERVKAVSDASRVLNRVGYFIYRDFVGDWFIQEQYAGLILESFLAMRPYLKALRDSRECEGNEECENGPWFLRRFYLLLVVISYQYLCKNFNKNCEKVFEKYKESVGKPVPSKWLADDVKSWLKKKGYKEYLKENA